MSDYLKEWAVTVNLNLVEADNSFDSIDADAIEVIIQKNPTKIPKTIENKTWTETFESLQEAYQHYNGFQLRKLSSKGALTLKKIISKMELDYPEYII